MLRDHDLVMLNGCLLHVSMFMLILFLSCSYFIMSCQHDLWQLCCSAFTTFNSVTTAPISVGLSAVQGQDNEFPPSPLTPVDTMKGIVAFASVLW